MIPKFRAFHDGEMLYNASKVGNALYWDDGDRFDMRAFEQETPPIMMQCIGYADINKVDIYESDVLKDLFNRILLVEWRRSGFWFKALTETNFAYAHTISQWFEFDIHLPIIIGNIFENPSLLEVSK